MAAGWQLVPLDALRSAKEIHSNAGAHEKSAWTREHGTQLLADHSGTPGSIRTATQLAMRAQRVFGKTLHDFEQQRSTTQEVP